MKYIRNLAGQVLVALGALFLVLPLYSLLRSEFKWQAELVSVTVGAILVSVGLAVLKSRSLQTRPRFWAAAVSGLVCSVCSLSVFAGLLAVCRWPAAKAPDWLILVTLFLSVVGIGAALVCIFTGARALLRPASPPPN
jgi:hypothetical protein